MNINLKQSITDCIFIFIPVLVVGSYFNLNEQHHSFEGNSQDLQTSSRAKFSSGAYHLSKRNEADLKLAEKFKKALSNPSSSDFDKLIDYVATMPVSEISLLSTQFIDLFENSHDLAMESLSKLSYGLAEQGAQTRALDVTGYLPTEKDVPNIERRLMYDWSEKSLSPVTKHFEEMVRETGFTDKHQAFVLASLVMNERAAHHRDFVSWIENLDQTVEMRELQTAMLGGLIHSADPGSKAFKEALSLFEARIDKEEHLTNLDRLALKYSPEEPEKALKWISDLPIENKNYTFNAFAAVLHEVAVTDMEKAIDTLSSETFLGNYFDGTTYDLEQNLTQEAKDFYDKALDAFMRGVLTYNPQVALDSADAFYSTKKSNEIKEIATEMLNATTADEGHSSNCQKLGCNHDHH